MRLLYVSRSHGIHDKKFISAWDEAGFETLNLELTGDNPDKQDLLLKTFDAFNPDLVQVGPITTPGDVVSELWDGPLISTSWGFDLLHEANQDLSMKLSAQKTLHKTDLLFCDNQAVIDVAVKMGMSRDKIVQFPWGLESSWLDLPKSKFSFEAPTFISTRNHESIYRVGDIIRGFASSVAPKTGSLLIIAGSGSETEKLHKLAVDLKVQENIRFLGALSQSELKTLLSSSDVYLSSSETDGTSISLLEAMASGLCVVVSDIPGNRQWVTDETGWTFELGNIQQITHYFDFFSKVSFYEQKQIESRRAAAFHLVAEKANWGRTKSQFWDYAQLAMSHHLEGKTL